MSQDDDEDEVDFDALFRRLRKDPNVVRVGRTYVDVAGIIARQINCADGLCMQQGDARKLSGKSCCTTFRVPLERRDLERIATVVDQVRTVRDVGAAIDAADEAGDKDTADLWKHDADGLWLETRPTGACVFLSRPRGGIPRCSIHEWALSRGLDFRAYKPEGCCLYPMYLIENGDELLVTSYGSPYMLEVDDEDPDDIKTFACTLPPAGKGVPLLVEFEEELNYRLGPKRWGPVLEPLRSLWHAI